MYIFDLVSHYIRGNIICEYRHMILLQKRISKVLFCATMMFSCIAHSYRPACTRMLTLWKVFCPIDLHHHSCCLQPNSRWAEQVPIKGWEGGGGAYVHSCMHLCVCACVHICVSVCVYVCVCACVRSRFNVYIFIIQCGRRGLCVREERKNSRKTCILYITTTEGLPQETCADANAHLAVSLVANCDYYANMCTYILNW